MKLGYAITKEEDRYFIGENGKKYPYDEPYKWCVFWLDIRDGVYAQGRGKYPFTALLRLARDFLVRC